MGSPRGWTVLVALIGGRLPGVRSVYAYDRAEIFPGIGSIRRAYQVVVGAGLTVSMKSCGERICCTTS
jgi:hypothetical protein